MEFLNKLGKAAREVKRTLRLSPGSVNPILFSGVNKLIKDLHKQRSDKSLPDFEPVLKAQGGEHLVFYFEDPNHPDIIAKINYYYSRPLLRAADKTPAEQQEARADVNRVITQQTQNMRVIRKYFGQKSIPASQSMVREMPVNLQTIALLDPKFPVTNGQLPESVPVMLTVQKKINLPPGDKTISLTGYYPERSLDSHDPRFEDKYLAGHETLTDGPLSQMPADSQIKYILDMYPDLKPVAKKAETDPQFKNRLKDFAETLIKLADETGITLDVAGPNNSVMIQDKNNKWQVHILDPLTNDDTNLDSLRDVVDLLSGTTDFPAISQSKLDKETANKAFNALNTLRVTNALATIAGSDKRLSVKNLSSISPNAWITYYRQVTSQQPTNIH